MHNIFEFRNQDDSLRLPNSMALHYLELCKFNGNKPHSLRTPFEKWLHVLKFGKKYATMNMPDVLKSEEGIEMAVELLKKVNADKEMRQLMECRFKEAIDTGLAKAAHYDQGRIDGRKEGKQEGIEHTKLEIAIKMLQQKLPEETISSITGLSPEQLAQIKHTINLR